MMCEPFGQNWPNGLWTSSAGDSFDRKGHETSSFFFGAGISRASGKPLADEITEAALNGEWHLHTNQSFNPGPHPSHFIPDTVTSTVQRFLHIVNKFAHRYLTELSRTRVPRKPHYEDLFSLAQQAARSETDYVPNLAVGEFLRCLRDATKSLHTGFKGGTQGGDGLSGLAETACDFLHWVPEDWRWVRFGSVISELRNGVPLRPSMSPPGIPILRISAARPGRVDLGDVRYMPNGDDFLPVYVLRDGDLLFTRYNGSIELLGVCGMVRGLGKQTVLYPDKLMRVRFNHKQILPGYVEVFFSAPEVHERVVAKSKSSAGQNGVSGSDIKGQPFALPPLPEQQEIVRRVEELFALSNQIEARFTRARAQVDKLAPSLLARAFAGKLVAQDPNDEPAAKLLERIRAAREAESENRLKAGLRTHKKGNRRARQV